MNNAELTIPSKPSNFAHRNKMRLIAMGRSFLEGWAIYRQNRLAVFGLVLLLVYTLMAFSHPILMKTVWSKTVYDPAVGYDIDIFTHPSPPSVRHLLGTDALGRDVLSMLLAASQSTYLMAIAAALVTALTGTLAAAFCAYFRGIFDFIFMHLADLFLLAPAALVMVVIGFVFDMSPVKFGVLYGILNGLGAVVIILRAHALTIVPRTFIDAARVSGGSGIYIVFKHLIPHMLPLVAVNMMMTVTGAIFADGFIAFMGLSRARLNWGSMIYDSFTYRSVNATITWNVLLPSALAISFFAAAFYMISRGLHEVAEPRLRER